VTNEGEIVKLIINVGEFKALQKRYSYNIMEMANTLGISRNQLWRVITQHSRPGQQFIACFKKTFPEEIWISFFKLNAAH